MPDRICQRPGCGNPIRSSRRQDTRWCSRSCEGKARRAARRKAAFEAANPSETSNYREAESGGSGTRDDPRNYSDFGELPGDFELASEIDALDETGIHYGDAGPQADEHASRFTDMLQQDQERRRTPRETWRKWRAHGRRHGTEHPEQAADRVQRHRAAEAARMTRVDASTAGRVQDRFDPATSGNLARNASASRRLNARHAEQPPTAAKDFDFRAESAVGGPYRSGRPAGQRSGHSGYAWQMDDGFR